LAPTKEFAASGFQAKDLFGALFSQRPTIHSFADFVKRRIIPEIIDSLQGLFDVQLSLPSDDLTATLPAVGGDGISLGEFTEESTQSFPPVVTIDKVQVRIILYGSILFLPTHPTVLPLFVGILFRS
jgi:hypothetical protein